MEKRNSLVREVLIVSVGELLVTGVMLGIFALGGFWSTKVLWGGLLGLTLAIAYYGLMAVGVAIAAKKATNQDINGAKGVVRVSMLLRFGLVLAVLGMAFKGGLVNPIAAVIPMFLLRPVISVCELFRKSGEKNVS